MAGLIIDLFAGGGGASEAIHMTTGRHPDVAVNHDEEAIALHAANHPSTLHLRDDIRKVDVAEVLALFPGRTVDLLWASPDCKDHSKAKGGKPKDKNIRGLAWEVLRWSAKIRRVTGALPRVIALENVEEFQDWGPLHVYGKRAGTVMKRRRKETFGIWKGQLESLGFRVEHRELVAADYGAPTTRKRLFLIARSDGQPITWPEKTHGARTKAFSLFDKPVEPYRSAASIIDWSLPIPSIFGRKRPLQPKTQARIAKGIRRYVIESPAPFIVPVTHTKGGNTAVSADEPLRTITTAKGGEFAVSAPTMVRTDYNNTRAGCAYDPQDALRTITTQPGLGMASAFLKPRYGEREGQEPRARDITEPAPTVVPTGNGADIAAVVMQKMAENGQGYDPRDPMHTAMAGAPKHYPVAAYLSRQFGTAVGRDLENPHPTVMTDGAGGKSQVIAPVLDKYYATGVAADPTKPLDAITSRDRFGLASAFLEQANTGVIGHDARQPVSTIAASGSHQRLCDVRLAALEAAEGPRRRQVLEFLWTHFGEPSEAEWQDPAATPQGRLRFGLVVLDGIAWQIVDIGMRMLVPRELYRAQGFRDDYVIELAFKGKPLTKTAQTRMAGNSVSPPPAAALLRANLDFMELGERVAA